MNRYVFQRHCLNAMIRLTYIILSDALKFVNIFLNHFLVDPLNREHRTKEVINFYVYLILRDRATLKDAYDSEFISWRTCLYAYLYRLSRRKKYST